MEKEAKLRFQKIKDRQSAYELLSSEEKKICERVAHNAQILYVLACEKNIYPDNLDLNMDLAKYIFEAVKYYGVGRAIEKVVYPDSNNDVPIKHVELGSLIFYKDIRNRDDILSLSDDEKHIRKFGKEAAYYHHERWDGKGFPDGLIMEETPIVARITHLVFELDELTFQQGLSKPDAFQKIQDDSGRSFDPKLVDVFYDNPSFFSIKDEKPIDALKYIKSINEKEQQELAKEEAKNQAEKKAFELQKKKEQKELEQKLRKEIKDELANEAEIRATKKIKSEKGEYLIQKTKETKAQVDEMKKVLKPKRTKKQALKDHVPYFTLKEMKQRPIEMHYSPVFDFKSNETIYLHSDLIINTHYYGQMTPAVYENIAEKTGQIADMIKLGMEQLIEMFKVAAEYDINLPKVSIKIYRKLFDRKAFFPRLIKTIQKNHLEKKLIFVISEDVLASGNKEIYDTLQSFRDIGIEVGVTDLGSEYNLIRRLSKLNFDYLIIDQKYFTEIDRDKRSLGIVKGFKNIATSFKVKLICQGINTQEQVEALKSININKMQGRYFGDSKTMFEILA